jgi:hypothetical protein
MKKGYLVRWGLFILGVMIITGFLLPASVWAVKEIKIGVIYPLTGGAAAAGRELRAGAELSATKATRPLARIWPRNLSWMTRWTDFWAVTTAL